jgi:hypothetical protein
MNLVRKSLLPLDGIESVIFNTKQMSCTILPTAISRGLGVENAMRYGQDGQATPVSRPEHHWVRIRLRVDAKRDVNFMTASSPKTGTKLTPALA